MSLNSTVAEPKVQSRVAWGAILAGAAVAIALFMVLGPLFVAVDLSIDGASGIAKVVSILTVICMFVGAWVASHLANGETAGEALLYGIVQWSVTAVVLLYFAMNGVIMSGSMTLLGQIGEDISTLPHGTTAAWWSFGGAALSLIASIIGASVGGPWLKFRRASRNQILNSCKEVHA